MQRLEIHWSVHVITQHKLAVFGYPISHSLSPRIHMEFAKQFGISIAYEKIQCRKDQLKDALEKFLEQGGMGANITTPLKEEAMHLAGTLTSRAQAADALNTFHWQSTEKRWLGDNTDGEGFIKYLAKHRKLDLNGLNILLLGAGGAARALVHAFLSTHFGTMTILNRDLVKASTLKRQENINILSYEVFNSLAPLLPIDIIINATSSQFSETLPPLMEKCLKDKLVVDLSYSQGMPTHFLAWAKSHYAAQVDDGLGMLVEQAALSFELWFNKQPDTFSVYQHLRSRE